MEPIVIAGGCYFEACEAPHWRALYGSGGRAAHALVDRAPVILHTYFPSGRESELYPLVAAGIDVRAADSESALAFAYFHPLSDPVLAPERAAISTRPALRAAGSSVLRFGFVEGDAIVNGRRVVYDPQSAGDFAPFGRNGSSAESLAIVLNAHELRAAARKDDLDTAARTLLDTGADVVVAKSGVQGAFVFSSNRSPAWVPAFWSEAVFKIGTGDVFSAIFAHAWAQLGQDPVEAAYAASRSVARYAGNRSLPLPEARGDSSPIRGVGARQGDLVHLIGSDARLSDRWLLEEAAWRLQQLGALVRRSTLRPDVPLGGGSFLILADQLAPEDIAAITERTDVASLVFLSETDSPVPTGAKCTTDFTTALYWACWLSSPENEGVSCSVMR